MLRTLLYMLWEIPFGSCDIGYCDVDVRPSHTVDGLYYDDKTFVDEYIVVNQY